MWAVLVCAKSLGSQQELFPFKWTFSIHLVDTHSVESHHIGLNYNVTEKETQEHFGRSNVVSSKKCVLYRQTLLGNNSGLSPQ